MKLSICLFLLLSLTITSAIQIEIVIDGRTYNTPMKGYWKFLKFASGDTSHCCPFERLKMKVGEPDDKQIIHMIGSFSFTPELESRCMKTRFGNYSTNMDISGGYNGDHGWIPFDYNTAEGKNVRSSMWIKLNPTNSSILDITYNDYDEARSRAFVGCEYQMIKDDSWFGLLEGAGVWKICLVVAVLIIGIGVACRKNIYKAETVQVQEEDVIQRYQAPQQYIQQQPEHVL